MNETSLYSVNGYTPGTTSAADCFERLWHWAPLVTIQQGRAEMWRVELPPRTFTLARCHVTTLLLVFWDQTLAAIEGDLPCRGLARVAALFADRLGTGTESWSNAVSTARAEIDTGGRCYFQIAHRTLLHHYMSKLVRRLNELRASRPSSDFPGR